MSAAPPSVSVVIPMYNAEKLIERCLAPLLAMLGRGEIAEIIVVNDGSTDRSPEIVRRACIGAIDRDGSAGRPRRGAQPGRADRAGRVSVVRRFRCDRRR